MYPNSFKEHWTIFFFTGLVILWFAFWLKTNPRGFGVEDTFFSDKDS